MIPGCSFSPSDTSTGDRRIGYNFECHQDANQLSRKNSKYWIKFETSVSLSSHGDKFINSCAETLWVRIDWHSSSEIITRGDPLGLSSSNKFDWSAWLQCKVRTIFYLIKYNTRNFGKLHRSLRSFLPSVAGGCWGHTLQLSSNYC